MTPEQQIDELLKPRMKCIGTGDKHYPGSRYKVGDILYKQSFDNGNTYYCGLDGWNIVSTKDVESHTHLFQPLPWYAQRRVEEMPEYVKWSESSDGIVDRILEWDCSGEVPVCKSERWPKIRFEPEGSKLTPATEQDFLEYTNKAK